MGGWVIGVDLGGTKTELGLVSPGDEIAARRRIPTQQAEGPQALVRRIVEAVAGLAAELPPGERVSALGICTPGPVDHRTGALIDPPNLPGLHHTPLRDLLAEALGVPVSLEHDAKAAALGEHRFGAGRGADHMVYIVAGTGVGAAIIAEGRLFRGQHNAAGEIGHMTLDRHGELCTCGARGCVQTYLSGPGIAGRYQKAAGTAFNGTGEDVARLAGAGDPLAARVMQEAGEALGLAVAAMAGMLDVELYVLGGSVAKAGSLVLEPARRTVPQYCVGSVGKRVRIVASTLAEDAAILGCAWQARQLT